MSEEAQMLEARRHLEVSWLYNEIRSQFGIV